jgi:hypothetical protein
MHTVPDPLSAELAKEYDAGFVLEKVDRRLWLEKDMIEQELEERFATQIFPSWESGPGFDLWHEQILDEELTLEQGIRGWETEVELKKQELVQHIQMRAQIASQTGNYEDADTPLNFVERLSK